MKIEFQTREDVVFDLFDTIKSKLNKFLLIGLESIADTDLNEISQLIEKLSSMNLNLISASTQNFFDALKNLQKTKSKEVKSESSVNALKMITTLRVFEAIMSVELIRSNLLQLKNN